MRVARTIAALLLVNCGGAGERSTSLAITEGTATDGYPAVVALRIGAARCTGVVISADAILTAAHCVDGLRGPEIEIVSGSSAEGTAVARGRRVRVEPSYDPANLANDVAVVVADGPLGIDPLPISRAAIDRQWQGRIVRVVGYGRASGVDRSPLVKREGTSVIDRVTDSEIDLIAGPSRPCSGDSGGPAIADVDGRATVIALTSGGDEACRSTARDVRVDVHGAFIDNAMNDSSSCSTAGGRPSGWLAFVVVSILRALRKRTG